MRIITDSSAEFTVREAAVLGIHIVPLSIVFGDTVYAEDSEISREEFYERLANEYPHTAAPATEQFTRAFIETGGEETLVILISSALSGTVNAAKKAVEEGGFSRVHVYDSLSATAMLRIMVETACKHRDKTVDEVIAILDALRPKIRLSAYLDTLDCYAKGKRAKKSLAGFRRTFGLKSFIEIKADGSASLSGTARGHMRARKKIAKKFRESDVDESYPVYFLETDNADPTHKLMEELGQESGRILRVCCSVGAYIGANAAGMVYVVK